MWITCENVYMNLVKTDRKELLKQQQNWEKVSAKKVVFFPSLLTILQNYLVAVVSSYISGLLWHFWWNWTLIVAIWKDEKHGFIKNPVNDKPAQSKQYQKNQKLHKLKKLIEKSPMILEK